MLERVQDAPAQTLALRASGTVKAGDVTAAIEAALGSAATGLVMDHRCRFRRRLRRNGAWVSPARRWLTSRWSSSLSWSSPEQIDGATLNSFEAWPVGIRQFAHADENAALEWAAAARRGE